MNDSLKVVKPLQGIKGPSAMIAFDNFDCVDSYVIDYMHNILLGVVKDLLSLWLSKKSKHQAYFIGDKVELIEAKLIKNKPPKEMTRLPINILKCSKWKANQCRAFLLYYGFGALKGILPDMFLDHFLLLSKSIYILMQENISQEEMITSEKSLLEFVSLYKDLYEKDKVKFNIHNVLHIHKKVVECGPLFCYSLFPFESKNGQLKKYIKGGRRHMQEAANKYVYYQIGRK